MKYLLLLTLVAFASAAPEAEANAVAEADPNAEAEADPWLHYGYGLGHAYYGLGGYYRPYGYLWGRKKREAEAAPEAAAAADPNAEADPWYGYYGHGYYGHRYYGYPYAGYYLGK